jgi:hypothetical protein
MMMKRSLSMSQRPFHYEILPDSEEYLRMAENTLGWREILSDGGKYSRMARNTLG